MADDAADQVLEGVGEHAQALGLLGRGDSLIGSLLGLGRRALDLSLRRLILLGPPSWLGVAAVRGSPPISARAALKASACSGFSGCGSTPEGEVSPENFCQSPVRFSRATTASLG